MSHFKRKRAVQKGECLNSPKGLERHSPPDQPTLDYTIEKGAEKLVDKRNSSIDSWTRLIGRANEEQNGYKWASSDCFVRHWKPGYPC